jgi:hypothetical protein
MASEHQTALLQEYNSCDVQISRIDTLIWQTASVVFPITLAGFGYFGLSSTHIAEQFLIACAIGLGSIALLITWCVLSHQWYGYQAIAFYRMREIETELGLWHYRYSFFMRQPKKERTPLSMKMGKEEQTRFQDLERKIGGFPRIGLRVAVRTITIIFFLGWIGVLAREYLLTFKP